MTREQELQAIEEAVKSGRIRRVPMWADSGWDELPFRERRALAYNSSKKAKKMRNLEKR